MITANNFFCHWLKESNARRYPDDKRILPTNESVEIYQYAAQQLKHLPEKSLNDIRETLLYEKNLPSEIMVEMVKSTITADRTDTALGERVTDFLTLTGRKTYYRILLGYFYILRSSKLPA